MEVIRRTPEFQNELSPGHIYRIELLSFWRKENFQVDIDQRIRHQIPQNVDKFIRKKQNGNQL